MQVQDLLQRAADRKTRGGIHFPFGEMAASSFGLKLRCDKKRRYSRRISMVSLRCAEVCSGQTAVDTETTRADKDDSEENDRQFDGVGRPLQTVTDAQVHGGRHRHGKA